MPELPEVETTRRGIAPHVEGETIARLVVREARLRWPIPPDTAGQVKGRTVDRVARRAKYLVLECRGGGGLLIHLGMSGSLSVVEADRPAGPHDRFDIVFEGGYCLRLNDPRRFGSLHWVPGDPHAHELLKKIGPEPLSGRFDGAYLHGRGKGRAQPVKHFIMDAKVVAGVGNIYANEALFYAGIHPGRAAGRISLPRYRRLAEAIRAVLEAAIRQGGTTLKDFTGGDGKPGYFQQQLAVYGRDGEACPNCGAAVRRLPLGQRGTFYCPACQR